MFQFCNLHSHCSKYPFVYLPTIIIKSMVCSYYSNRQVSHIPININYLLAPQTYLYFLYYSTKKMYYTQTHTPTHSVTHEHTHSFTQQTHTLVHAQTYTLVHATNTHTRSRNKHTHSFTQQTHTLVHATNTH